jgi:hypothetical protein
MTKREPTKPTSRGAEPHKNTPNPPSSRTEKKATSAVRKKRDKRSSTSTRAVAVVSAYWHIQKKETRLKIRFHSISGRKLTRLVRLADIEELAAFRRTLVEAGVSLTGSSGTAASLHADVLSQARTIAADRKRERRLTSELGWHDGGAAFVSPGRTLPKGSRLSFEPDPRRRYATAATAGTFEGWFEEVARPAACSSRMMVAIGAALVSLLLRLLGRKAGGFGITFRGASRIGKSLTLRIAKSVIDEPTLGTWGVSRAGGTALLLGHTDLPVFLDETAATRGGSEVISELTNILSAGKPDALDPAWLAQHGLDRSLAAISSVLLASTEGRLHARRRGERVRLIEEPAARPGSFGVVDYPDRADPPIRTPTKAAEHLERMDRAAAENHGHALPRFAGHLIEDRKKVPRWAEQYMAKFAAATGGTGDDGWARSMHASFALIYAAMRLARRYDIVPWTKTQILEAVVRCWEDTMAAEAAQKGAAEDATQRILAWVRDPQRVRGLVGDGFDPKRVDDYEVICDTARGQAVLLVRRERLVELSGSEAALDADLANLATKGDVIANRGTSEISRQKRLPGMSNKLRFVFFRP